jgi:hypothetical protein
MCSRRHTWAGPCRRVLTPIYQRAQLAPARPRPPFSCRLVEFVVKHTHWSMLIVAALNLAPAALLLRGRAAHKLAVWAAGWPIGVLVLLCGAVLFGAPVDMSRTASWAAMQSTVTCMPLAAAAGSSNPLAVAAWLARRPDKDAGFGKPTATQHSHGGSGISIVPALAGLAGAWLGSVVCLLDWEEPWQPWPISSTVACGGASAAAWACLAAHACFDFWRSRSQPRPG